MGSEVRAHCMRGVGAYIRSLDRERAQLIESTLSDEARRALHETSAEVWYPISVWKEALDRIVACAPIPKAHALRFDPLDGSFAKER